MNNRLNLKNRDAMKKFLFFVFAALACAGGAYLYLKNDPPTPAVADFEECEKLGGKIIPTKPRQCSFGNSRYFFETQATTTKLENLAETENKEDKPQCSEFVGSDYPAAASTDQAAAKEIDYSFFPEAKKFQTEIVKGLETGAVFARDYKVAQWECGEGCFEHAIINLHSGKIIIFGLKSVDGVAVQPDSRLLIVNPEQAAGGESQQEHDSVYYELTDDEELKELCRVKSTGIADNILGVNNFSDPEVGLEFKYPSSVSLSCDGDRSGQMCLELRKENVGETGDNESGETANIDSGALALLKGEFGQNVSQALAMSKKVYSLGAVNAREYVILEEAGSGSGAVFYRNLDFYRRGFRISIDLVGDIETIATSSPEFLEPDANGNGYIWKDRDGFYQSLEAKEGSISAQLWYDTFNEIVKTIRLVEGIK